MVIKISSNDKISEEEFYKFGKQYGLSKKNTIKFLNDVFEYILNYFFYVLAFTVWSIIGLNFFLNTIYGIDLGELNALILLSILSFGFNMGSLATIVFVEKQLKKLIKGAKK